MIMNIIIIRGEQGLCMEEDSSDFFWMKIIIIIIFS